MEEIPFIYTTPAIKTDIYQEMDQIKSRCSKHFGIISVFIIRDRE